MDVEISRSCPELTGLPSGVIPDGTFSAGIWTRSCSIRHWHRASGWSISPVTHRSSISSTAKDLASLPKERSCSSADSGRGCALPVDGRLRPSGHGTVRADEAKTRRSTTIPGGWWASICPRSSSHGRNGQTPTPLIAPHGPRAQDKDRSRDELQALCRGSHRRRAGLLGSSSLQYPSLDGPGGHYPVLRRGRAEEVLRRAPHPRFCPVRTVEGQARSGARVRNRHRHHELRPGRVRRSPRSTCRGSPWPWPPSGPQVLGLADRVTFHQANLEALTQTVPVEPYDLVYSFGVIHHTPHPDAAVAELRRYVAPGGR